MAKLFKIVSSAVAILLLAGNLASCANGKNTQTADQVAAVDGVSGSKKDLDLQNVHFRKVADNRYELVFRAINNNLAADDSLESITSPSGINFAIAGKTIVPAQGVLQAGVPNNTNQAAPASPNLNNLNGVYKSENDLTVKVAGDVQKIKPGLTNEVIFTFKKAGVITLTVPNTSN